MSAVRNMKPLYIWCCCHQVQLCCKTGLANSAVQDCVENVKAVATQLIKSSTAHNKFLECAEAVGFEVVTTVPKETSIRWNSMFMLLEWVLQYEKALKEYSAADGPHHKVEACLWPVLVDIKNVLAPLAHVTKFMEKKGLCNSLVHF